MGDRNLGRDVFFYSATNPDEPLGGLISNPSISVKNFLSMLEILVVASHRYSVSKRDTGAVLIPTEEVLRPGKYDIMLYSRKGTMYITAEPCIARMYSSSVTGRNEQFKTQVRERDGKCVITGSVNSRAYKGLWRGFEAAHVFPLRSEDIFIAQGLSRWITNRVDDRDTGINSCQNGLLMLSHIHRLFDGFEFSINPDDDYKIICFNEDPLGLGGGRLDPICRDPGNEQSVRYELLRWHFRQAVFANMRGAGEAQSGTDSPPGPDVVGVALKGPEPANSMGAEIFLTINWSISNKRSLYTKYIITCNLSEQKTMTDKPVLIQVLAYC
ncbi:hypothetical protein V1504DRAFT_96707 [Lipomyces starkeyi]